MFPLECLVELSSSPIFKSLNIVVPWVYRVLLADVMPELEHIYMVAIELATQSAAIIHSPLGGTSPEAQLYVEAEPFQWYPNWLVVDL